MIFATYFEMSEILFVLIWGGSGYDLTMKKKNNIRRRKTTLEVFGLEKISNPLLFISLQIWNPSLRRLCILREQYVSIIMRERSSAWI